MIIMGDAVGKQTRIGRRAVLRNVGALGLAGAGLLSGKTMADAGTLQTVNIVNPSGNYTAVCEQLLKTGTYFADFGLQANIVDVTDGTKIIAALVSGSADICGGAGFSGVFPAIARGAKLKLIGGAALSPLDAIYAKDPAIKTVKDLVGKTVGVGSPGALLHQMMVAMMQKEGVDYRSVKFVNVGSAPNVFRAIIAGTVDAGPSEIDFADQTAKYGVHMLDDGDLASEIPIFTNQAFFASDKTIATKRELLVKTLAAHAEVFRFIASPGSHESWFTARRIALGKDNPVDAQTEWNFFQKPNRLATNLILSKDRVAYMQKLNIELGVQNAALPYDQVADMSLAHEAIKLLG